MKISKDKLAAVFLMALCASSMSAGYKILRAVSDSLLIADFGASRLPYFMTLVPFGMLGAVFVYSRALQKFGSYRAMLGTIWMSAGLLLVSFVIFKSGVRYFSGALYLFKEIYILLIIGQIWSFVNSILTDEEGGKLNGPIVGVSQLGAFIAGLAVQDLPKKWGSVQMLPLSAAFTLLCSFFVVLAFRKYPEKPVEGDTKKSWMKDLGLESFRKEKVMIWLAIMIACSQVVSILFELTFYEILEKALPGTDERSSYLIKLWNVADFAGFALTFALTPFLLSKVSAKFGHYLVPLAHIGTAFAVKLHPSLRTASVAYFLFKSLQYNLFEPAKELFYIPLSFDSRYRAKQLIDSVVYRSSKGAATGILSLATLITGGYSVVPIYPVVSFLFLGSWLGCLRKILRSH